MNSRKEKLIKNTVILGIGTVFSKCITLAMIPLFSKWLTTEDYGLFDVYATYITLLIPFLTLSSGEAVFRFLLDSKNDEEQKSIITAAVHIFVIGFCIVFAGAGIFLLHFVPLIFVPFLIYLLAEVINSFSLSCLRGLREMKAYTIANIITMIGTFIGVTIFVYFMNMGLRGMMLGYAAGYFISDCFALIKVRIWSKVSIRVKDKQIYRRIVRYAVPLIPNAISWWVVNVSDRTIINVFLGGAANGIYAISNKIPSICTNLFGVFHLSWQENISTALNDQDRNEYCSQILGEISRILITLCSCIIVVDFAIFDHILDPRYSEGFLYVPILITAIIFSLISQFFGGIFIALKETKYNGSTTIVAAIVNVTIHLALVKLLGLYAASLSTLVCFAVLCVLRYVILIKKGFRFKLIRVFIPWGLTYIYFVFCHYINLTFLNYVNVVIAAIVFLFANRNIVYAVVQKMHKRVFNR